MKTVVISKTPSTYIYMYMARTSSFTNYMYIYIYDLTSGTFSGLGAPPDLTGLARPGALM